MTNPNYVPPPEPPKSKPNDNDLYLILGVIFFILGFGTPTFFIIGIALLVIYWTNLDDNKREQFYMNKNYYTGTPSEPQNGSNTTPNNSGDIKNLKDFYPTNPDEGNKQ